MTEQEKEIKTIKERTVTVKLSDADVERISKKCGIHGLTVGELFENFIGDLVHGTYTNGSDEVYKANDWFDRCWFGMFPEETLLWYLLDWGHDVDDFLTTYDELKYFEANPEEFADEVADLEEGDKLWFENDYHDYVDDYLEKHTDVDLDKEIETCRKWLKEMQALKEQKLNNVFDYAVKGCHAEIVKVNNLISTVDDWIKSEGENFNPTDQDGYTLCGNRLELVKELKQHNDNLKQIETMIKNRV